MGSKYEWALLFHLIGVVLFFSGAAVATAAFEAARRREQPSDVAALLGLARIGAVLVGVGTLVLLPFGLWLVDLGDWGFGSGWVSASLALLIVAAVLGAIGGQRPKRARLLARAGGSDDLRRLLDDPITRVLNAASGAAAVAVLVLMVFKPGA